MLPPAALAACSLAAGPSVLQPHPSPLGAEEETARWFDSGKCRRMLERVHASGWSNVCGFSRAGLNLGQHTFRAQPQQGRDIYYVRNEKVASTFLVRELNALFNGTYIRNTRHQKAQFGAQCFKPRLQCPLPLGLKPLDDQLRPALLGIVFHVSDHFNGITISGLAGHTANTR